ncbi:MAG: aspartate aminotransferase family protein, partial [Deltaproteobacteria bacterium]|nr:aspartate aminotransferase family protein [Deltaproteobacteria bacterium]
LYINRPMVELAEKLAQITPGRLQRSFFTNSGTEANETAVHLARLSTGRQEVIALRHGYSGRSMLAMDLTGSGPWRPSGDHVVGIKHALAPYCYRCPLKLTYPSCGVACAGDIEELIQTTTSGRVAALIAEPVQGIGGFITPPPEYFRIAVEIVRRHGGLFICDEVQTGFGRTGRLFAIEHYGVEPDIMTCAKALGNGMPVGATIATPEVAAASTGLSISTFGGNPVAMAAALATIEVIEEEKLADNARVVGAYLRARLDALRERHRAIGDVRGLGLMQGVEVVKEDRAPNPEGTVRVMERARERGLLVGRGGLHGNVIRLGPPLTVTQAEVDQAVEALDLALTGLS